MRAKQNPLWVLLCIPVVIAVAIAVLACLPAWEGMGDMSALEAVWETVRQWFAR